MNADPWLERWLPLLAERAGVILELGCGSGMDTQTLVEAGHSVIAIDLSPESIAKAKARIPGAVFHCQDLREPFPSRAGTVVASLSLHYFPWPETLEIVGRIRASLEPGGLLLCRLNSIGDHHYGAVGHPRISGNFYLVDGSPKRFFSRDDVTRLFGDGWTFLSLDEQVIHRYEQPKVVWEAVLERTAERVRL